jgi:hypothetical protein
LGEGRKETKSTETLQNYKRFKFLKVLNGIVITVVYHLTNSTDFNSRRLVLYTLLRKESQKWMTSSISCISVTFA